MGDQSRMPGSNCNTYFVILIYIIYLKSILFRENDESNGNLTAIVEQCICLSPTYLIIFTLPSNKMHCAEMLSLCFLPFNKLFCLYLSTE